MSIQSRIRNFRGSHRGQYRPTIDLNPKEEIINKIFHNLYSPHWKFWQNKLLEISIQNMEKYDQKGDPKRIGIFYVGKAWFVPIFPEDNVREYDILPLHEHSPDIEKELIKITANLAELDIECYEVKRFLAGLLIYGAPLKIMEEALGRALYSRITVYLKELEKENKLQDWNEATQKSFDTYINQHDYLITAMCQRIMMALITRDAFAQHT